MKLSSHQIKLFQKKLLEFYSQNSGDKPWNIDKYPYKIWIFEVVMQQTRMEQGLPYYERLIKKFPTLTHLANAEEDELFSVWKGLGYYSRARNLHFTANHIVKVLKGKFPNSYSELLKLKGVGEYTAAAIASFAFDENIAVLDGNVHRILSRFFGLKKTIQSSTDKKYFQSLANQLLIKGKSASFNQAMMDMGSQICKPQNPSCENCVFSTECIANIQNRISELPPPKIRPILKDRYFYNLFVEYRGKIYLEKRVANDIWKGLYQGIVQEGPEIDEKFWKEKNIDIIKVEWTDWQKQILSHQRVMMKIGRLKVNKNQGFPMQFIHKTELENLAFPRVVSQYFESVK
ncbi:MAG: A/G-specific adenine glycosylase [Chitinophagales bacterium]|nr:A/G-specific adenine glycosylase [Chitinophagales bacterium]